MSGQEILRGTCGTCRAFDRNSEDPKMGECKAGPPDASVIMVPVQSALRQSVSMQPQTVSVWPPVPETGWCLGWASRLKLN